MSTEIVKALSEAEAFSAKVVEAIDKITFEDRKTKRTYVEADWPDVDAKGNPRNVVLNTKRVLTLLGIGVRFDEFSAVYDLCGLPGHNQVSDAAVRAIAAACQQFGYRPSTNVVLEHLYTIGDEIKYHPVRELFDRVEAQWDHKPRLETWLSRLAKVEDSPFVRFVSKSIMLAHVRRIRVPGFKYKYVPVLEGGQDARKSSFLKLLAFDTYFTDSVELGSSSKETLENTLGKLLIEFGELASKRPSEIEHIKLIVAREEDRARLSYDRVVTARPRQFCCWGTTNAAKYMNDATGAVRFWPLKCEASVDDPIDLVGLKAELGQLWAEAAVLEREARENDDLSAIYPSPEMSALAKLEQDDRFDGDEIYDRLELILNRQELDRYLIGNGLKGTFVSFPDVLRMLDVPQDASLHSNFAQKIARAMTKLGWTKVSRRVDGKPQRGFTYGDLPKGNLLRDHAVIYDGKGLYPQSLLLEIEANRTSVPD